MKGGLWAMEGREGMIGREEERRKDRVELRGRIDAWFLCFESAAGWLWWCVL